MIGFLRFVGVLNGAVWFGSAIFLTFVAAPTFFSSEMGKIIAPFWAGAAAQLLLKKYFILHIVCAVIAALHMFAEWLYSGRHFQRGVASVIGLMLLLGLLATLWMEPKLNNLHRTKHWGATPALKERAHQSFRLWHGASRISNLIILAGLCYYLYQVTSSSPAARFLTSTKFRG